MPRRIHARPNQSISLRFSLALRMALFAAILIAPLSVARAQQVIQIPNQLTVDDATLTNLLSEGETLEQEGKWGEALTHYDSLQRRFPDRSEIENRRAVARIHFDLKRRFSDNRFRQHLTSLSRINALAEYSEVLNKINTHHVDTPNWGEIVAKGSEHLKIALSNPTFRGANQLPENAQRLARFQGELQRLLNSRLIQNQGEARYMVDRVAQLAQEQLGLSARAVIQEFTCSAVGSLDHYSAYLTGGQLDEIYSQIEGNFIGLGIELKTEPDAILIMHVIPGSPAERAGITDGERIIQVDTQLVSEISGEVAADLLKGEADSFVNLVVRSTEGSTRQLRVQRRQVDVPSVTDVEIVDTDLGIGYLKITSFQKTTTHDFDAALWDLHRAGMRSLVIDLRGNPGGLLNSSVEIADRFITEGTIVSTRGRAAREDFDYRAHQSGTWRVPLVILIDGNSASASEILAGAILDHQRGTIVGERSYGKGSVQGIFPLAGDAGGLRLTTAKFFSPSGQAISHHGINPDVLVHETARPTAEGWVAVDRSNDTEVETPERDAILEAGLQTAREQLTRRP